ncbi:MAG: ATP-binding cassette domain-containing protein, partial [Proteobacteria bacterium]|nr:ATP-binding cassette domain-containing protein [Pseudomonadota bacterium]
NRSFGDLSGGQQQRVRIAQVLSGEPDVIMLDEPVTGLDIPSQERYTLLLLFIQPLRRVSHLRPLKWINKLAPVYDAYFSPFKDKHRYWFGAMLLVRGILLVLLTVTSVDNPKLNVFALFLFIACLRFFISIKNVYKQVDVRIQPRTFRSLKMRRDLWTWSLTII